MRGMLNSYATIYRHADAVDTYGTPTGQTLTSIGTYAARLTRSSLSAEQSDPMTELSESYRLYLTPYADVQAGDLAEVDGIKYRCSTPYKPSGHHYEVDCWREVES